MFAHAVMGRHLSKPLGLVDVTINKTGWSIKTVKQTQPLVARTVRLISGRNSPDYSSNIENPRADPQKTGDAVLDIWNARFNLVAVAFNDIRIGVLIRNMEARQFCLFEVPIHQLPVTEYEWSFNRNGNLEGRQKTTGKHCFTWQPHGSQFTVIREVPGSAHRFLLPAEIPFISIDEILELCRYDDDWVSFLK